MKGMTNRKRIAMGLAIPAAIGLLAASLGVAVAEPPSKKLQREVRLFERVLDDMLVDSPNWLVPGRENARGYYVPGHGVVFTFQTSLVDRGHRRVSWAWGWWDDDEEDYRRWRERERDRDEDEKADRDRDLDRGRYGDREERLYARGKQELVDLLHDFGDVFESAGANETVTVVAHLDGSDLFWDEEIRRLEMVAKIADLRAAAAGTVSEEELERRVVVQEY